MKVNVLALDGVFDLGLAAVLDALQTANELIEMAALSVPSVEVRIAGVRKTVKTSHGRTIPLHDSQWRGSDDDIVPPIRLKMPAALVKALARPAIQGAGAAIRQV